MCYQTQKLPNPENIVSRKSESTISPKIVINFYIVIRIGECGYLVLTSDHSFGTRFVIIMAVPSILIQLFQSAIFSATSAKDLDFIDPEVEAQMDEEEEITIRGARGVGKDLIISIHPKTYLCSPSCLNSCLN